MPPKMGEPIQTVQTEDQKSINTLKSVDKKPNKSTIGAAENPRNEGPKSDDEDLWDNVPI